MEGLFLLGPTGHHKATIKQGAKLAEYGVKDPDAEWGDYLLLRPWDEQKFLASLRSAENTPRKQLKPDGNRAVIYCSTTDPYQVIRHPDPARQRELAEHARFLVRRSLELIRDESTLNVRILTRSPLARADFDLFRSFGKRLVFGMSLPTLRNDLAKVYEPKAPAPSQRLAALRAAKEAGLHVYVAMAPTYPECDEADLRATLKAVAELEPITIFHEPINIRAENVARIEEQAADTGRSIADGGFCHTRKLAELRRKRAAHRFRNCQGTRHREAPAFVAGQIPRQPITGRPDAESQEISEAARTLVAPHQRVAEIGANDSALGRSFLARGAELRHCRARCAGS